MKTAIVGAGRGCRSLLEFIVEESLAGRSAELKAYVLATRVLHRPEGFDPQVDPIVRVEVGRLRATLDRFLRERVPALEQLVEGDPGRQERHQHVVDEVRSLLGGPAAFRVRDPLPALSAPATRLAATIRHPGQRRRWPRPERGCGDQRRGHGAGGGGPTRNR